MAGKEMVLEHGPDGYDSAGDSPALATHESIRVVADGDTVPAFDVTQSFPGMPSVSAPLFPAADDVIAIDLALDLTVQWSPIGIAPEGETMHVSLRSVFDVPGGLALLAVDCSADPAAQTLTVPVGLLEVFSNPLFPTGAITVLVATETRSSRTLGPYDVHVVFTNVSYVARLESP